MLRMMVYLSACLAVSGSSSEIAIPLTLVGSVRRKGPVKSSPAFGFGSQVSVCVGPPAIQSWITDFALGAAAAACPFSRNQSAVVSPIKLAAPTLRNPLRPGMSSMVAPVQ